MSYARRSAESDVYVFLSVSGHFDCCSCTLLKNFQSFLCDTTAELLNHLEQHIEAGDLVPEDCIARLSAEAQENDAWIAAGAPIE